jgi:hypothetical protein
MQTTMKIIQQSVDSVLDKYLAGELKNRIMYELCAVIRADLEEHEPTRLEAESNFHDCVNELCMMCGQYQREHEGACDGCRWLKLRRGW